MKDITDMEKERQYMKMALELAQKGMGFTAPNPMVGAVIVKRGKVIARDITENTVNLMQQGSRVTYMEAPSGCSVHDARASLSA